MATALCLEPFSQSLQGYISHCHPIPLLSRTLCFFSNWKVFITLLAVHGEDLKLGQVTNVISSLFTAAGEELGVELYVEKMIRHGKK